jgi:hypothetical protein
MKAITGYAAVLCVSLMLAATAVKGMAPAKADVKKSSYQASIEARKAALAELDNL